MTITAGALAVVVLVILFWRGGGGRPSIVLSTLAGAAIGGIITSVAVAVFGVALTFGSTLLHAIP